MQQTLGTIERNVEEVDKLDEEEMLELAFAVMAQRIVADSAGLREPVLYGVSSNEGVLF